MSTRTWSNIVNPRAERIRSLRMVFIVDKDIIIQYTDNRLVSYAIQRYIISNGISYSRTTTTIANWRLVVENYEIYGDLIVRISGLL